MQRKIVSVGSITFAIKGRDLLRKYGIKAYIERKTNPNGDTGCGYVIVAEGNGNQIVKLLKDAGIKILDVQ